MAVLGHELGHFKHKDILKMIALSAVMLLCLFFIFGNVSAGAYEAIGLGQNGASIIIFWCFFSPIFSFLFRRSSRTLAVKMNLAQIDFQKKFQTKPT